jgi:DNA (cytosine-5)-methyltransferase 1
MIAYYNEIDPYAAQWLRNLIAAGHIATGDVDERSIETVHPDDVRGYTQCHFFAGIGGWSYALRLAGWPDDRPVWTGSCPCQPFSSAGKQEGGADRRHLWPSWSALIGECRPAIVFGEQVDGAIAHGWLDLVAGDLERCGYAIGAASLPAAAVGAPHIRQRLWFGATLGYAAGDGRIWRGLEEHTNQQSARGFQPNRPDPRRRRAGTHDEDCDLDESCSCGVAGFWEPVERWESPDGTIRLTKPGVCPMADGISARVGRLRGYGNAVVPRLAAEFIGAYLDAVTERGEE